MRNLFKLLHNLSLIVLIASGIAFIPSSGGTARAQEFLVIVPALFTDVGGGGNVYPINCGFFTPSMRYQQVYAGSELLTGTIVRISFRLDGGSAPLAGTLDDVTVNLSTTQAEPGALSSTFADNVGPDVTTVFSGDLSLSAAACALGPCPFEVGIPLETTFPYDSEAGNLLVDITIPSCVDFGLTSLDSTSGFPDITTRAGIEGSIASPTANFVDNTAVITEFIIVREVNIPTLSEWGMIAAAAGLALVGVFFAVRRKKTQAV
jgi:hypothetical protein